MKISSVEITAQASSTLIKEQKELLKACEGFEAVFNDMVFKAMRKTVTKNDLFGSSKEEEMFSEMLDTKLSEQIAQTNPSGIAAMLYRQLSLNPASGIADKKGEQK